MRTLTLVALAAATATPPLFAQVATLDEGSFTISVKGERVGREDFRIRSTPAATGPEIVATANVTYADRRVLPQLQANEEGVPVRYVVEVKNGPGTGETVRGVVGGGRARARVTNARGESANEFVVSQGALVIDDDVFHQYYFVTRRGAKAAGSVAVIVPRRNAQVTMRVTVGGADKISIGGTTIDAQRFTITEPGGDTREVWADSQGRLLKVAIPARGVVALRDDPPR